MDKAKIYEPGKERQGFTVQFNPNSLEYMIYSNEKKKKAVHPMNHTFSEIRLVIQIEQFYQCIYSITPITTAPPTLMCGTKLRNCESLSDTLEIPQKKPSKWHLHGVL